MPRRARGALTALVLAVAGPGGSSAPAPGLAAEAWVWRSGAPGFGGFSGLRVAPDGAGFVAIGDRGAVVTGRLLRDASGRIAGVAEARHGRLRDGAGRPLAEPWTDAEGLAVAPDGTLFVAFEARHRIVRLAAPEAPAEALPALPMADRMPPNKGIEALAFDPTGRLLAIPEQPPRGMAGLPVWRLEAGGWTEALRLPFEPPWLVADADLGPDGSLYLLERDLRLPFGFASRLRRFEPGAEGWGEDGPGTGRVVWQSRPGRHGNLEGLSLWRDGTGALRATMISDDNFLPVLATAFVEVVLDLPPQGP